MFALPIFTGSDTNAACGRVREWSEWLRSTESKPALSGDAFVGHRNRTGARQLLADIKNASTLLWRLLCSHYLFSRPVTRQLSSAQMSVTSVFGMGTGGPSSQSTPTRMDGIEAIFYIKSVSASNSIRIVAHFYALVNKN